MMDGLQDIVLFHIVYLFFVYFLVFQPNEIVSLGFSIPALFSSLCGSEGLHFVFHHIVRISLTIFIHSLLPIGYFILLGFYIPQLELFNLAELNIYWHLYLVAAVLLPVGVASLVYYWTIDTYANHPVACSLNKFAPLPNSNRHAWKSVASRINAEFRRVDKFSSGLSLLNRVYVTDNWIIKIGLYSLHVASHQNIEITLTSAKDIHLAQDGTANVQILSLVINSSPAVLDPALRIRPFRIQLNSLEYKEFTNKLQTPVRLACDVIIKQSLPERFLDAFREQIAHNEKFMAQRSEIDNCIGCMQTQANVKLVKQCDDINAGECKVCNCRPMWCLECMGKWFASRQDQNQPNTWMSNKATCATCRATFCMLDICPIEFID